MNLPGKKYIVIIYVLLGIFTSEVSAQLTRITGRVTDATSGQGIPFANVYFLGSSVGTTTNDDGYYKIVTARLYDSLTVTFIGYQSQTKEIMQGEDQQFDFMLMEDKIILNELIVRPDEDLVDLLMIWILKNKENNNTNQLDYYEYEVYNTIQIDINNVNEKFKKRKVFRSFEFIFDNVDTSALNGKAYLPVFLSEAISDFYYRKKPRNTREIIRAYNISGIENQSITQYLGGLYKNIDIYDNLIFLFEKNFISPISNSGKLYYKYTIVDSVFIDNKWCFEVTFRPKRKQELTFTGSFWVNDTTFAIKRVDMKVVEDANLNFINDLWITQEYNRINNRYWMVVRETMIADINPIENQKKVFGFFSRRTSTYKDFVFNQPKDSKFYSYPLKVNVEDNAIKKSEVFWEGARHRELSLKEQEIYHMVDSIKNVPVFQTYLDILFLVTNGYWVEGNFEIGPLYKALSFNAIEGTRLRLGGRTSNHFSKKIMFDGYLAYGFKDQEFKYGAGITYMISKNPRRRINTSFKYDLEQLGQSPNAFAEDNFFAAFFRRSPANKLTFVREYSGLYEHEWFSGFSNTFRFINRDVFPLGDTRFIIYEGGDVILLKSLTTSEIQVVTRYAPGEKYLYGEFERISMGTRYPVLELLYGYGIPGFLGGEYEYHRLQVGLKQKFNIFSAGWSTYVLEAGKIWGTLPYPLLKIHDGNETFLFYENAFNLMNYYEFISDQYASFYFAYHFDGLLLNHIPLIRKLKWRSFVHARTVIGSLTEANKSYSEYPVFSGELLNPYYEAGAGIENIFKVVRVDAIWRLSGWDKQTTKKFGIFVSLQFSF